MKLITEVRILPHHFYTSFLRLPILLRIFIITVSVIFTFGTIIAFIEPKVFPSVFEGIWWAIITASTVGYGDLVPETKLGKITGMILIFLGAAFLSSYFVTLSTSAVRKQNEYLEGKMNYKGNNHFIIIGWNGRSQEIIQAMINNNRVQEIILIDQTLDKNPLLHKHVHFIKGRSNSDETLIQANVFEAEKVLITAEQNLDEFQADMSTVIALLTIKGLNPNVKCIVEILTSEQIANAKRAGADEIIQTNVLTSIVMLDSLFVSEMGDSSLLLILNQLHESKLTIFSSQPFIGKSFIETSGDLLKNGTLLIGVRKGEQTMINPSQTFIIEEQDELLVVTK